MKKLISMLLCLALCLSLVTVASAADKVKIGVLAPDSTSSEAIAFKAYYKDYIEKNYNVEFIYSEELADAADEKVAIDTFISSNCKAIISLSSYDRVAQIDQCEEAGVYYAIATGTLTPEQYEEYKDYEYYVGAIGPSTDIEYKTGYEMAKYYIENGMTDLGIFGGGASLYVESHVYRLAGMLGAIVELGGEGVTYEGCTTQDEIVAKVYEQGGIITTGQYGKVNLMAYVSGFDFNDAWYGKLSEMVNTEGIDAVLTTGLGVFALGSYVAGTDVEMATVDAYTAELGDAMNSGILDWLAGKFSASIGPIFRVTLNAINGQPTRTPEGYALALDQGYWIATSAEEFANFYAIESSTTDPAYNKDILDTYCGEGVSYEDFAAFVNAYSFEEINSLKK